MNLIAGLIIIGLIIMGFVKILNGLRQFSVDSSIRQKAQVQSSDTSIGTAENIINKDAATDEEILKNMENTLKAAKTAYRTFSLAKGGHERIPAHVGFQRKENWEYELVIERKGYDLWLPNLRSYQAGTLETNCYSALKEFEKNLYGVYKEDLTDDILLSTEWIADELLILDDPAASYESDFTLRWTFPAPRDQRARELFRDEVQKTKINLKSEE